MGINRLVVGLCVVGIIWWPNAINAQGAGYIERQLLCALDQAPCDAWGRQIKESLPEIIGRNCQNCNRSQLNNVQRVARFVQVRYPNLWAAIVEKYSQPQPLEQYYAISDIGQET